MGAEEFSALVFVPMSTPLGQPRPLRGMTAVGQLWTPGPKRGMENGSTRGLSSAPMKITAAVVPVRSAPFEIQTLDLAAPLADEVLVRVVASGMCHTDLHARDGYFPNLPYPVVCGHEGAGIIEQVGAAVVDLAPGDPVVISFPWCGECGPCRATRRSYGEGARLLK